MTSHNQVRQPSDLLATTYLEYLFSPAGQESIARHHDRMYDAATVKKYAGAFPSVRLVTVEDVFGGRDAVTTKHLAQGGILDKALLNAQAR